MKSNEESIQFIGMKPTRTLLRYVKRQLEKWLDREFSGVLRDGNFEYSVQIEREETGSYYYCAISLKMNFKEWRSYGSERTLHEALKLALRDLKPVNHSLAGTRIRPIPNQQSASA